MIPNLAAHIGKSLLYGVRALGWKIRTGRIERALTQIELFDQLEPNMRRELARNCTLLVSPANTILTEPDIYDRNLYVVATGQVRISIPDHPDEDQRRGFLLGEQGVFGYFERAVGNPDRILAVTETNCEVLMLKLQDLVGSAVRSSARLGEALNDSYLRTVLTAYLRHLPYFAHLPQKKLETLAGCFGWADFQAGQIIFRQGDHGVECHLIRHGRALLQVTTFDRQQGRRRTKFHELNEGDTFGELALLGQTSRPATVQADTALSTLTIRRERLFGFYGQYPESRAAIETAMTEYVAGRTWLEKGDLPVPEKAQVNWLESVPTNPDVVWLNQPIPTDGRPADGQ